MTDDSNGRIVAGHCNSARVGNTDLIIGDMWTDVMNASVIHRLYLTVNDVGNAKPRLRSPLLHTPQGR